MIKRIKQGAIVPAWYGVAWREWDSHEAVCLPVGLNAIVAVTRWAWFGIRFAGVALPDRERDAYAQGYRDGRKAK